MKGSLHLPGTGPLARSLWLRFVFGMGIALATAGALRLLVNLSG